MSSNTEFKFYPCNKNSKEHDDKVNRMKMHFKIVVVGCGHARPSDLIERAYTNRSSSSNFNFPHEKYNNGVIEKYYLVEYCEEIYPFVVVFKFYPTGKLITHMTGIFDSFDGMIVYYYPEEENSYSICSQIVEKNHDNICCNTIFVVACSARKYGKRQLMKSKMESLSKKNQRFTRFTPSIFAHETVAPHQTSTSSVIQKFVEKLLLQYDHNWTYPPSDH